ncbi:MAG: preprotein translocase subunit SecG [Bacteroidia bacterium]
MFTILAILSIVVAVALTFIVIIQNSKGGGLSSTFGASNASQVLGARRSSDMVENLTWYLAGALAIVCFMATIAIKSPAQDTGLLQDRSQEAAYAPGNVAPTQVIPSVAPGESGGEAIPVTPDEN